MKQKQSKKEELEIRKAPEELTEQDLERVTGGLLTKLTPDENCNVCTSDCSSDSF